MLMIFLKLIKFMLIGHKKSLKIPKG